MTYGGATHNLTTKPSGEKEYTIADHLGNTRLTIEKISGTVKTYDYEPFGAVLSQNSPVTRLSFIDKEKDKESGLGDFGVRKYDDDIGRFLSVDPLWEKFRGESPYHYSYNNPVRFQDGNGKAPGGGGAENKEEERPDNDRRVTFAEAREWYRKGDGKELTVELNKIDLSKVKSSEFSKVGDQKVVNLDQENFADVNDALVFGSITLEYLGDNKVKAAFGYDTYDFDQKEVKGDAKQQVKTIIRNIATKIGEYVNGGTIIPNFSTPIGVSLINIGTPFKINIIGEATIGK